MYDKDFLFGKDTIDFVTVALEFCSFLERAGGNKAEAKEVVDKCTKILPLLYLKTLLIPAPQEDDWDLEESVTEEGYELLRGNLSEILGQNDTYLSAVSQDMKYSDTPIAATISEDLADIYQDLGNFLFVYREGIEQYMSNALAKCRFAFDAYWGGRLLNCLNALHPLRELYGLSALSGELEAEEDLYE